jgi:RsiW-degrading membrane proteinase PrsW (M82 family)
MTAAIALTIATLIPLVFLYAIYVLNQVKWDTYKFVLYCFAWGCVAYFLAVQVNDALININLFSQDSLIRFGAPIIEEILKGLFLLYLVRRPNFAYFVDGAMYGFACGIGFAIFENYEYVFGNPSVAIALSVSRVLSTNLIHATGSALIGIALGYSRLQRGKLKPLFIAGGLILAIGLHALFNNIVSEGTELLFAFVLSFVGIGFIIFMIYRGLEEEKRWIEEALGMTDRVTSGEAAIVNRLNKMDVILAPIAQHFGPQKASESEQFLLMQARLGLLRKTVEKLQDEKMRAAAEAQIQELRVKIDELRRTVGTYCMIYLRTIFPEDASPIYDILQERLASTDKSLAGTGLWKTLDSRLKPSGQ